MVGAREQNVGHHKTGFLTALCLLNPYMCIIDSSDLKVSIVIG
jgi:hypothetical protein